MAYSTTFKAICIAPNIFASQGAMDHKASVAAVKANTTLTYVPWWMEVDSGLNISRHQAIRMQMTKSHSRADTRRTARVCLPTSQSGIKLARVAVPSASSLASAGIHQHAQGFDVVLESVEGPTVRREKRRSVRKRLWMPRLTGVAGPRQTFCSGSLRSALAVCASYIRYARPVSGAIELLKTSDCADPPLNGCSPRGRLPAVKHFTIDRVHEFEDLYDSPVMRLAWTEANES